MKKGREWKRMDDRGLSLVEVLVAVVVLALVLVPTLRLFASSMSFNTKARQHQRAITVAESVMEGFKSYNMDSLCRQFGAAPAGEGEVFRVLPVSGDPATLCSVTADDGAGSPVTDVFLDGKLNQAAQHYVFEIQKTPQEDGEYSVSVDVTKRAANAKKILDVDSMDTNNDCMIEIPENTLSYTYNMIFAMAQDKLATEITAPADMMTGGSMTMDTTSFQINSLDRVINVQVDDTGVKYEIEYTFSAQFKYQYLSTTGLKTVTYPGTGETFTDTFKFDFNMGAGGVVSETKQVYSGDTLKNIYLYYFPLYKGKSPIKAVATTDSIKFSGTYPADMKKIYVVKQKSSILSVGELQNGETNYTGLTVSNTGSGAGVKLISNLDKNIGGGLTVPGVTPSGFVSDKKLSYDPASEDQNGLIDDGGLMYDVTVTVSKAGSADVAAMFKGTMND